MPMASQDPLPQAQDFLSQCEKCHLMVGQLWLINGEYVCDACYMQYKPARSIRQHKIVAVECKDNAVQKNIYGWTKWYGANNNLFVITPEWFCQACQEKQTDGLPSYLIKISNEEYARICSVCLNVALQRKINNIFDLMELVRLPHAEF
jgi:hypothetical protein